VASPAPAAQVTIQSSSVTPKRFFFDSASPVEVRFTIQAPGPTDMVVRFGRGDEEVRSLQVEDVPPGAERIVSWNGVTAAGAAARDGNYRVLVGAAGGPAKVVGKVTLRGHLYPVRGPHGFRGPVGDFGAARNGGRTHEGFDVVARCGTPLVAARGGVVVTEKFDAALDGHYVIVKGRKEGRMTYRYSHLPEASPLEVGDRVRTGDRVGVVGKSGNAASVGCHLHFELRRKGRFIDPEPHLRAWDRFS
jgi:murein DD-endopeptidase MepM/ murein hydrolase activator NlpD